MLVVVRYLEAWRHLLEEAVVKFETQTDHKNLKYFMKVQKLNRKQARQALYLSRFDFILKHVLGSKIGKADSLSRRPNWEIGVEKNNEDETLVKPKWLEVRKTETVKIIIDGVDLLEKVRKLKVKDNEIVKVVEEMKQAKVKMLRDKEQREVNSVMYKEEKMYISKDEKLRVEIIWLHHDMLVGGYRGQQKTVPLS